MVLKPVTTYKEGGEPNAGTEANENMDSVEMGQG